MNRKLREIIGWYGVGAILLAYLLTNIGVIALDTYANYLLNLSGALGIGVDAWFQKNYQPVLLNVVWAVVAVFGLVGLWSM